MKEFSMKENQKKKVIKLVKVFILFFEIKFENIIRIRFIISFFFYLVTSFHLSQIFRY